MKSQKIIFPPAVKAEFIKNEIEKQKLAVLAKHPNAKSSANADYYTHDAEWSIIEAEDIPGLGRLVRTLSAIKDTENDAWSSAFHMLKTPFGPLTIE